MSLIFVIVALVCFILAAFGVTVRDISVGWLGLAFWLASTLV